MLDNKILRAAGQVIEKDGGKIWLVLSESEGEEGKGYLHSCGTEILAGRVAHPIWDGPFKCSGTGRVQYEDIPYCPKCEAPPDFHGTPIDVPWPGFKEKV